MFLFFSFKRKAVLMFFDVFFFRVFLVSLFVNVLRCSVLLFFGLIDVPDVLAFSAILGLFHGSRPSDDCHRRPRALLWR